MRTVCAGLIGLVVALSGCQKMNLFASGYTPERLAGEYRADFGFADGTGGSSAESSRNPAEEFGRALAKGIAQAIALELKPDRTFVLTMIFPVTGTYTIQGDRIVLKPDATYTESKDDPKGEFHLSFGGDRNELELLVQDGGKTLKAVPTDKRANADPDLLFRRKERDAS
ncbi:MAG: hypothetical protein KIS66_11880 [Fimbriimonadaceae bacterium]|nr:hypothetical protein [Fimbriimonadaceae bacterium]